MKTTTPRDSIGRAPVRLLWPLLGLALLLSGCDPDRLLPSGHDQGEEHAHEHGEGERAGPFDASWLDRIRDRRCEHDLSVLDCDECRYEVGVVDVAPALLDPEGDHLVRVVKAGRTGGIRRVRMTGEVAFDEGRIVHISPRISGVARRVFVELGDRVRTRGRLLQMDSLQLGRLRSRYLTAMARLELARQNFEREKRLFAKRISSGREKAQTKTNMREAEIELRAAAQQLSLLGFGERDLARLGEQEDARSGRMTIRSPMDGEVVAKHVAPGEWLAPEKEILTVADLTRVWVLADVVERDLEALLQAHAAGRRRAEVRVAAFSSRTFAGELGWIGATVDRRTRTVKARVEVPNPDGLLRPGMFVEVEVELGGDRAGLLDLWVPAEAVVEDRDELFVFVRAGPRRFVRRDVKLGARDSGVVEVTAGLSPGEEIVVQGAFLLKSDILREKMGAGCAD